MAKISISAFILSVVLFGSWVEVSMSVGSGGPFYDDWEAAMDIMRDMFWGHRPTLNEAMIEFVFNDYNILTQLLAAGVAGARPLALGRVFPFFGGGGLPGSVKENAKIGQQKMISEATSEKNISKIATLPQHSDLLGLFKGLQNMKNLNGLTSVFGGLGAGGAGKKQAPEGGAGGGGGGLFSLLLKGRGRPRSPKSPKKSKKRGDNNNFSVKNLDRTRYSRIGQAEFPWARVWIAG